MDKQKLKIVLKAMSGPVDLGEKAFLTEIAKEVKNATDERLKRLMAWCIHSAAILQQCGGDTEAQATHAALMASNLHVEMNYIEDSGDLMDQPRPDLTPWTSFDRNCMVYEFYVDVKRKVIGVKASAAHILTSEINEALEFEPVEFPLTVPVERFEHLNSPIILAR
jgi:hypothetical protein